MASTLRLAVLVAVFCQGVCAASLRYGNATVAVAKAKFTVEDKIKINGNLIAEGTGIDDVLGCNTAPKGATSVTVCGCNVKVTASLLTECQPYGKYSHTVGACNCAQSGCVTDTLMSGYTDKFKWVAASYKVVAC